MPLDVVICTHGPRPPVLARAIAALAAQAIGPEAFEVLLVDNASSPPVPEDVLSPLRARGIAARRVEEPSLGLSRARLRALAETSAPWILFVDDDNELAGDYVAVGLAFAAAHEGVGAFGGRLLLPPQAAVPPWAAPFLPFLGLKDEGDQIILARSPEHGPWEPPGAGLFVRREVLRAYAAAVARDGRGLLLGRQGKGMLASCDDSLLVRQAPGMGLATAYVPALRLVHHLDPRRFRLGYLIRLLSAFGSSIALLEALVGGGAEVPRRYRGPRGLVTAWHGYRIGRRRSHRFGLAMAGHHLAAWRAWARLAREARAPPGAAAAPAARPAAGGDHPGHA